MVDSHGAAVPPYAETRNYVAKVSQAAGGQITQRTNVIYKITEVVDGQVQTRYTDQKPKSGPYEVVPAR